MGWHGGLVGWMGWSTRTAASRTERGKRRERADDELQKVLLIMSRGKKTAHWMEMKRWINNYLSQVTSEGRSRGPIQ